MRSAAVVHFLQRQSFIWRSCSWETNMDSSKTSNWCRWRKLTRSNHNWSMTRKRDCCEIKGVLARDGCDSYALLDAKSDMLNSDISKRLPQQLVGCALGTEPEEEAMTNAKAVRPDGLPVKLLKLGCQHDQIILSIRIRRVRRSIRCDGVMVFLPIMLSHVRAWLRRTLGGRCTAHTLFFLCPLMNVLKQKLSSLRLSSLLRVRQ